ncbi:smg4 upf3 domain-containing protein [Citrus sinensis]|uniref:Smg4 upf3 domain-containing protein n=1 Tax=Citrus sinensis TaxID=2711 RepID=A0ACB8K8X1_CITSI|nr:smg4 upf3 domain-containing protein [Citrus sinensis]
MKGPLDRTKVVVRNLPPAITQPAFTEQIDGAFGGRYNWVSFRQGKTSQKHQSCARAYLDFKKPEDVLEFAEFFNGHVFVNEKGVQFKTIVEYAPSQRVPKQWSKKDGREGTLLKDPEYLEFLEFISKPVENLPSAEIQLERREAERAGAAKEALIVTPLMDFVRQKRAAKAGPRRLLSNGKLSRRASGSSTGSPASGSSKRGSDKKKYVLRDTAKNSSGKDKSTYILVPKRDDQDFDKPVSSSSATGSEVSCLPFNGFVSGVPANSDGGKKKVLLLKGKEREISQVSGSVSHQQSASVKNIISSPALKQNQRRENSGRIIRGILLNKDARQNQASGLHSEQQISNLEKDKRPPRPSHVHLVMKDTNGVSDDKVIVNDLHSEKQERRTRNKDRPDRAAWTLRRSDGSYQSDESLSSSASQLSLSAVDSSEGNLGDGKFDLSNMRSGEVKAVGGGRSHRHIGRRGPTHVKDDSSPVMSEGKPLRRGGASGYGSHEKQVWVQKSSSGS